MGSENLKNWQIFFLVSNKINLWLFQKKHFQLQVLQKDNLKIFRVTRSSVMGLLKVFRTKITVNCDKIKSFAQILAHFIEIRRLFENSAFC